MDTLVALLGAEIYKDSSGNWHSNDVKTHNSFRMQAALLLAKKGYTLFVQGGHATDSSPSIASVIKAELLQEKTN